MDKCVCVRVCENRRVGTSDRGREEKGGRERLLHSTPGACSHHAKGRVAARRGREMEAASSPSQASVLTEAAGTVRASKQDFESESKMPDRKQSAI